MRGNKKIGAVALLIVWAISVGYLWGHLKTQWVPHDEGTLGLSAERVLQGQLPHRDFDDYTGGLTFVHAAAFRVFGINSTSMRLVLLVFFVAWIPALFYIASHFGPPIFAAVVTLLAVTWSVPNYPGPMPSWYNLFFATWGVAALLRYLDDGLRRWLFAAGVCGGLSFLAKVAAAYYVAGVLLFFVYHEQSLSGAQKRGMSPRSRFYSFATTLGLAAFLVLLLRMVRAVPGISGPVYFVAPSATLVVLLLMREFTDIQGESRERFKLLLSFCLPFLAGLLVPLVLFVIPYVSAHALGDLYRGLLAAPARAIRFASFDPHNPLAMIAIVPFAIPVMVAYECGRVGRTVCGCILGAYGTAVLFFAGRTTAAYYLGWCALGTAIPAVSLAGVCLLWRPACEAGHLKLQQGVMLLLSVTAVFSLIQFPFSAPIYFFYVAPFLILSVMALVALTKHPPVFAFSVLAGIYLLYPMLPATAYQMGISHAKDGRTERLTIQRGGGLRVDPGDARLYDELIPLVQSHAGGEFAYAAPDCPEVYFLSGLRSPSRHYFDFAEDQVPVGRMLAEFDTRRVNVVVIDRNPRVSGPMSGELRQALAQRYPHARDLGAFEVRWRE